MESFGFEKLTPFLAAKSVVMMEAGLRLLLILVVTYVGIRAVRFGLHKLEIFLLRIRENDDKNRVAAEKRVKTLIGLLLTICLTLVWVIAVVMGLDQIGLDITPIIASAGIVGLAVGFGAQNLVRDVINGFFMILENQVRVGDVAVVNGTGGLVEGISFRTITLRDQAGTVHIFPNGTVTTLANMTKDWSAYVMNIGVAYKEDTDRVTAIMREVGKDLQQDEQLGRKILEPIEIMGVDAFGESEVVIKARIKTLPIEQWGVGREYRRRLKKAFDQNGIEIPFPHRTLYMGEASPPFVVKNMLPEAERSTS
ncbi:mechanosensitive ion channel family protein [Candidatus Nitrospira allomarina]|jgi:moderate conductance mechanosensitive channel|uniref:Mechanosensitive ion channel family protein n=1 Tax=Candidatus Nitrospira allomarina TaxID=3020900 RepID=A0AA96G9M6_9BACT|nr:mechanosensitive ion channel family protein [Candidatus Nitrospira allomarina]WNM57347.1 mechanosensitive ion channel family protein [Candidatus Nitrospira allomarina]